MVLLKRQVFKYGYRASYVLPLQRGLAMSISFPAASKDRVAERLNALA